MAQAGVRVAWINTGTGLRYKVVLDRAMDIFDAFYNQHSLAWLNHTGITPPEPFSDSGLTGSEPSAVVCSLPVASRMWVVPNRMTFGDRGVHGHISNTPAEIESIIQPDPMMGKMDMSLTDECGKRRYSAPVWN